MYGAFLQEAARVTGVEELNAFSVRITKIGDLWREFAYKAAVSSKSVRVNNIRMRSCPKYWAELPYWKKTSIKN